MGEGGRFYSANKKHKELETQEGPRKHGPQNREVDTT